MLVHIQRSVYLLFGLFFVAFAIVGIALPLVPTTPFLLLAAFCFSRSSKKLHQWLLSSKWLGPIIQDWEEFGVINLHTKWLSTLMMIGVVSYPLVFIIEVIWVKLSVIVCIIAVLCFVWTRPSYRHGLKP